MKMLMTWFVLGAALPGNVVYAATLVYSAQLETTSVDASVIWDEALEHLVRFTPITSIKELQVKQTETIIWLHDAGNWSWTPSELVRDRLVTTVFDRSSLFAPVVPEGGGLGGDPYATPEQL